ncbi:hypothetical protein GYB59_16215, partial [bacterium]|nr:hypothetical protein [bacterium]
MQLSELVQFVRKQVQSWTLSARGRQQNPHLDPEQGHDEPLCWAITDQQIDNLTEISTERVSRAVDDLFQLWEDFEDLPQAAVQRLRPVEAMRLMQELTWCEHAVTGGRYYLPRVERQLLKLQTDLQTLQ